MKCIKFYCLAAAILLLHGCEEALERPLTGQKVQLLAPAHNLITADTSQILYWDLVNGAGKYQLQIVSPGFGTITKMIADTLLSTNIFPINLKPNVYQWKVRAVNNSTQSEFSDVRTLTIR